MKDKEKTVTQAQQKFLLNRLDEARRLKPKHYDSVKIAEPAWLKRIKAERIKAQRLLDGWEKRQRKARDRRSDHISKAFLDAKAKVLFGEPNAALKAIEKFEKTSF